MKTVTQLSLTTFAMLFLSGCGELGVGGGAYQATSVVVLPPDLNGDGGDGSEATLSADAGESAANAGPGTWTGRVVLSGSAPSIGLIHAKGAAVKDPSACSVEDLPDERLLLGTDNGVANVFIYLKKAPKGSPKPTPADEAVIFDQKYCRFFPHCMIVPTGQVIKVLSDDSVNHNTHSYPARTTGVNDTVSPGDRDGALQITYRSAESEPVKVVCDFHTWMNAWQLPVNHPYAALTDENGNFEIPDLPAGEHAFIVWHEAAKGKFIERKLKVSIQSGQTTAQDIEYAAADLDL